MLPLSCVGNDPVYRIAYLVDLFRLHFPYVACVAVVRFAVFRSTILLTGKLPLQIFKFFLCAGDLVTIWLVFPVARFAPCKN